MGWRIMTDEEEMQDRHFAEGWDAGAQYAVDLCVGIVENFDEGAVWVREALAKKLRAEWAAHKEEEKA